MSCLIYWGARRTIVTTIFPYFLLFSSITSAALNAQGIALYLNKHTLSLLHLHRIQTKKTVISGLHIGTVGNLHKLCAIWKTGGLWVRGRSSHGVKQLLLLLPRAVLMLLERFTQRIPAGTHSCGLTRAAAHPSCNGSFLHIWGLPLTEEKQTQRVRVLKSLLCGCLCRLVVAVDYSWQLHTWLCCT